MTLKGQLFPRETAKSWSCSTAVPKPQSFKLWPTINLSWLYTVLPTSQFIRCPCAGFNLEEIKSNLSKTLAHWATSTYRSSCLPSNGLVAVLNWTSHKIYISRVLQWWTCREPSPTPPQGSGQVNPPRVPPSSDLRASCDSGWMRVVAFTSAQSWRSHSSLWAMEVQSITLVWFD